MTLLLITVVNQLNLQTMMNLLNVGTQNNQNQWCSGGYTGVHGVYPPPNFITMRVPLTKIVVRGYTEHE